MLTVADLHSGKVQLWLMGKTITLQVFSEPGYDAGHSQRITKQIILRVTFIFKPLIGRFQE